jgi:hypothetical protein
LNWQEILERFTSKANAAHEQLSQLTITAKNFSEKLKNLSTNQISNLYNYEKVRLVFSIIENDFIDQ